VIFLVRHGETVWNAVGRQQGRLDSPLTAKGTEQARAAGRTLHGVVRDTAGVVVETSPLGRARQTAALICEELGLAADAAVVSALLVEHDFGAWQGLTFAEIDVRYPGARHQRDTDKWAYRVKDGESYALVSARSAAMACRHQGRDHHRRHPRDDQPHHPGRLPVAVAAADADAVASPGSDLPAGRQRDRRVAGRLNDSVI
jgi:broad specificity phosphatase PhoE